MSRLRKQWPLLLVLLCAMAGRAADAPGSAATQNPASPSATAPSADNLFQLVDKFWEQQIRALGGRYLLPKLVHFSEPATRCSLQAPVSGSFYCPREQTVYLEDSFVQRLLSLGQEGAGNTHGGHDSGGDLALGYLVAHEVGHHVQAVIGTTALVEQAESRSTPKTARRSWTALELQADCYAGLWAHWARTQGVLGPGPDVDAALAEVAATAQWWQSHLSGQAQMIDPLTHGSAEQRSAWFRRGFDTGSFNDCDTFGALAAGKL